MLNKMLKENLSKIEEIHFFEEDEETLKEKQRVEELAKRLESLYQKLEMGEK